MKSKPNKRPNVGQGQADVRRCPIEKRPVDSLHAHARQAEFFPDLSDAELAALCDDVRQNGMEKLPEVLPDGTIIRGHQRIRVAKELGWTKIDVIVREDLKDADEAMIIEALLGDNLYRRHLSTLEQAKCAIKLAEIECDREDVTVDWQRRDRIVKSVAHRLDCCDMTAKRYIKVSKTPQAIQDAFERDFLPLVRAAGTATLPPETRETLGAAVGELLEQIETKGKPTVKKEICALVETALGGKKRQKRVPIQLPTAVLHELHTCLAAKLEVVRATKDAIIADLRDDPVDRDDELDRDDEADADNETDSNDELDSDDELDPDDELDSDLAADPCYSAILRLRRKIVADLQQQCEALSHELEQIAQGIEAKSPVT